MTKICVHVNILRRPTVKSYAAHHEGYTTAANTPDPFLLVQLAAPTILQGCMLTAPSLHAIYCW